MSRLQDIIRVLVEPSSRLEFALQALYVDRSLENAEGAQLDALGVLVGQSRGGLLDDPYRERIRARVLTSKSNGTVEEIIAVMDLLTGGAADLEVDQQPPAAFVLRVTGVVVDDALAETLVSFLRDLASAGVRAILEPATSPAGDLLRFDVDNLDDEFMIPAME